VSQVGATTLVSAGLLGLAAFVFSGTRYAYAIDEVDTNTNTSNNEIDIINQLILLRYCPVMG
jgi:hypothetical protein